MKKFIQILFIAFFVSIVLAVIGCSSQSTDQVDNSENNEEENQESVEEDQEENKEENKELLEITVAVVNDFPPFEFIEDDELTGFDIDLFEAIAENQNMKIDWNVMKFDGIIPALQANQVDAAISAIAVTEERLEVVDFSDEYIISETILIVPKDSPIESVEDISGTQIVVKQGTTGHLAAQELQKEYDFEIKVLQDDATMYMDVETGNSDAAINVNFAAAYKINQDGENAKLRTIDEGLIEGELISIAVSKERNDVLERINEGLQKIKESGEYQEIHDKYFGM